MSEIKTAVIGVGSMGRHHARVYTELESTKLVGVADSSVERVGLIKNKYGVNVYADYREMLEKEQPEAVSIALPTNFHRQAAEDVMNSGADVLIEKPIASSIDEAVEIIEIAKKSGRKLMVGHIVRFDPVIQALKEHIENGEMGKIFQINCRRVGPFPPRIRDVGVVVDLATHDLDIMRFITGDNPVRVYAETKQEIHTENEDMVSALIHFNNDITGMLEINWLTPSKIREVSVLGECGMFRADSLTQELYYYENQETHSEMWRTLRDLKGVSEGRMVRYPIKNHEPLKTELEAFIQAIVEDQPVPVTGEDGLEALKLALALIESAEMHQVVEV